MQRQRYLTLWIIWLALLMSVLIYSGLLFSGIFSPPADSAQPAVNNELDPTVRLLQVIAMALAAAVLMIRIGFRRFILQDGQRFEIQASDDISSTRLMGVCIVLWAMCEAVALLGFIAALLSHDVSNFVPFGATAIALLIFNMPSMLLPKPAQG